MRKSTSHGDDIALYLLCRMYDKHAYVHMAQYGWSTLSYKISTTVSEITTKCDIELALIHCWSFGEILEICQPVIPAQTAQKNSKEVVVSKEDNVIPWNTTDDSSVIPSTTIEEVIPRNVASVSSMPPLNPCTVKPCISTQ